MRPACPRLFEVEAMRDGRLTGTELAAFGRHMTACRACAREAEALDDLVERLRVDGAAADELRVARERTRLLADFDRALLASGGRGPRRWPLWSATAVAVACGLFLLLAPRARPIAPIAAGPRSRAVITPEADAIWSRQVEGDAEKIVLERGAIAVHVDHAASRRGRLVVVLPDGELEDIGTTFTVTAADGHTRQVAVQEGSVLLRIRGRAPLALSAGQTWTSDAGTTARLQPIVPKPKPARRVQAPREPDEPAHSRDFRAAVRLLEGGDACGAAAVFARYGTSYPDDARAEDAAYLRVIALQRCGSDDDMKRAAREYLSRYPLAFRRAEVERLSR